ncbi:MAG: FG-GAP repeat domain-containing protein, partial [Planctomycetota bacterium]
GTGSFSGPTLVPTHAPDCPSPHPDGVAVADIDGDGTRDLVVAYGAAGLVCLVANDGHGQFSAPVPIDAGPASDSVIATDVDGDGDADLVVAGGPWFGAMEKVVSVLLNDGGGTFSSPLGRAVDQWPQYPAAGDLDGDGDVDVVVGMTSGPNVLLLNDGDGTLAPPVELAASGDRTPRVADLDGDLDLDLVISSPLSVLLALDAAAADVTGDGAVDVDDLVAVILAWGACGPPPCPADVNQSGAVDADDLLLVLLAWGPC